MDYLLLLQRQLLMRKKTKNMFLKKTYLKILLVLPLATISPIASAVIAAQTSNQLSVLEMRLKYTGSPFVAALKAFTPIGNNAAATL